MTHGGKRTAGPGKKLGRPVKAIRFFSGLFGLSLDGIQTDDKITNMTRRVTESDAAAGNAKGPNR